MRNLKKFGAILLATAMTLSMVGCGEKTGGKKGEKHKHVHGDMLFSLSKIEHPQKEGKQEAVFVEVVHRSAYESGIKSECAHHKQDNFV